MACNLTKIATVNLRDLEAALDLIGDMAMTRHYPVYESPIPSSSIVNNAREYFDEIKDGDSGPFGLTIEELIVNAFEAGWRKCEENADDMMERLCPELAATDDAYERAVGDK